MRVALPLVVRRTQASIWSWMAVVSVPLLLVLWALRNAQQSTFLLAVGVAVMPIVLTRVLLGFGPLLTINYEGVRFRKWSRPLRWSEMDGVWLHWVDGAPVLEFALRSQATAPSASFFRRQPQRIATLGSPDIHPLRILRLIQAELESRRVEPPEELRLPLELHAVGRLAVQPLGITTLIYIVIPLIYLGPTLMGFALAGVGLLVPFAMAVAAFAPGSPLLSVTTRGVLGRHWNFSLPWADVDKVELVRNEGGRQLRFHIRDPQKYLPYYTDSERRRFSPAVGLSVDASLEYADVNPAALRMQIEAELLRHRDEAHQRAAVRAPARAKNRRSRYGLGTWRR